MAKSVIEILVVAMLCLAMLIYDIVDTWGTGLFPPCMLSPPSSMCVHAYSGHAWWQL